MQSIFSSTISQLVILFAFTAVGILFGKRKLLPESAPGMLSKLLTCFFMPMLSFRSCAQNCRMENVTQYLSFISVSAIVVVLLHFLAHSLAKRFAEKDTEIGIYSYALTVSNMGYMGYPMMEAMFGAEMLSKMIITGIPVNIYIYTLGMGMMASGKVSFRSFLNPVFFGTFSGIIVGLLGIPLPTIVSSFLSSAAGCMSPVAMLIAGLVIARLPLRKLFGSVRAYIASALRLIVLPALVVSALALFGAPEELLVIMLVLYAMPIGMNTIVFPQSRGIDAAAGARLVLVSNLFCLLTIPLMVLAFLHFFPFAG